MNMIFEFENLSQYNGGRTTKDAQNCCEFNSTATLDVVSEFIEELHSSYR